MPCSPCSTGAEGDVVLLHACCHNPTGFDLSQDDWRAVLDVVKRRNLLPLIDFAYQGFGDGLEQDAWPCGCSPPSCRNC
jgi:aromatic-amino-acid transaminase